MKSEVGEMSVEGLGQRIKFARKRAKLRQYELAELIGVSLPAVASWETGKKAPNLQNLQSLADALGIRPGELFPHDLSTKEFEFLAMFRRLSPRAQQNLLELLTEAGDISEDMQLHREPANT